MYVNVPLITTSKQPKGAYGCLNGIRFLAFCAVIVGHTYALGRYEPGQLDGEAVIVRITIVVTFTLH